MRRVDVICIFGRATHVIWITIVFEKREIYKSSCKYIVTYDPQNRGPSGVLFQVICELFCTAIHLI